MVKTVLPVQEARGMWIQFLARELRSKKDVHFIIGDWNTKVGSQEIPGVTGKFGLEVQNEAGQKQTDLPRECTGHSKHTLPTTQEMTLHMETTRWSILKSF